MDIEIKIHAEDSCGISTWQMRMESGVHMETVLKLIQRVDGRETDKKQEQEERQLVEQIREVSRLMACNDLWFELECDENLIESCIYQREALQARYRYLLGAARRKGISCAPFQPKRAEG